MADRVGVDPERSLSVQVAGAQGDGPLVGRLDVGDGQVEVHLLLDRGLGPGRGTKPGARWKVRAAVPPPGGSSDTYSLSPPPSGTGQSSSAP